MNLFEGVAFPWVIGIEKGFQCDPRDPGNWTGGKQGVGVLKGTKYGVSAKAYPDLDIANLTIADAQAIAKRDYWNVVYGDYMKFPLALCVFDFGYNAGPHESVLVLQRSLGVNQDGSMGPATLAASNSKDLRQTVIDFTVERIKAYQLMPGWSHDGHGWQARAEATRAKALSLI